MAHIYILGLGGMSNPPASDGDNAVVCVCVGFMTNLIIQFYMLIKIKLK